MTKAWLACVLLPLALFTEAIAADFGTKGGPAPANVDEIASMLRRDPYEMELLISYGTSKGGSAGHLALALRDDASGDDTVYSANFYADRSDQHAKDFYIDDLMLRIAKKEYLFATTSSLADTASFGLDFGQIYKRSVIGVRVYGVPRAEKAAIAAYFMRINDDYHDQATETEYHKRQIKYDYMDLNCAKTIGAGFKYGAQYRDLTVKSTPYFLGKKIGAASHANIPTEMAIKLMEEWNARGYRMDVVLYRKYLGSPYVDPHEAEKVAFKDLPDRFPSVLSLDFLRDIGDYEDYDNLYAMYLLYNLGRYSIRVGDATMLLEIEHAKTPMSYREASALAKRNANTDSEKFQRGVVFRAQGRRVGDDGLPAARQ